MLITQISIAKKLQLYYNKITINFGVKQHGQRPDRLSRGYARNKNNFHNT